MNKSVKIVKKLPFSLCLTTGAILCATDPGAVVALLKELGVSLTLTVQIQGEALLNDGTAIVLYMLAYTALKGEEYTPSDVIILVQVALCAVAVGIVTGCSTAGSIWRATSSSTTAAWCRQL